MTMGSLQLAIASATFWGQEFWQIATELGSAATIRHETVRKERTDKKRCFIFFCVGRSDEGKGEV